MSQDREFEKYLQGQSALTELYADLPEIELPDHLDAAILAEAHRAVGARPGVRSKRRWTIPLGLVASLFVAVMIGLQLPYSLKDAALPERQNEERAAAMMGKSVPSSTASDERKVTQSAAPLMAKPKPERLRAEPAPIAAEAEVPAVRNAPALATPAATQSPAPASKGLELDKNADTGKGMALSKEKKSSGMAAGGLSDSVEPHVPAATLMAAPQSAPEERSQLKDKADKASLPPEDWLTRIKQLRQEGKLDEAREALAAFKKRYPDYPVPAVLEAR